MQLLGSQLVWVMLLMWMLVQEMEFQITQEKYLIPMVMTYILACIQNMKEILLWLMVNILLIMPLIQQYFLNT